MPRYRVMLPYSGEPLPERLDQKPFPLVDGDRKYELSRAPTRTPGHFLQIEPIEAADSDEAFSIAARAANGCFNRLCVEVNFTASLDDGYYFENLDNPADRGNRNLVRFIDCGVGLIPFPKTFLTDGGRRSASFFRRAKVEDDPVDRCRFLCLAIEEAGKRINKALKNNKGGEAEVIRHTIGEVFRKTSGHDRLKALRDAVPDALFSEEFRGGKNSAGDAISDLIYQHVRCRVMHAGPTAKKGSAFTKDTFAPFDPDDRKKAQEVLPTVEEVARLYVIYDLGLDAS